MTIEAEFERYRTERPIYERLVEQMKKMAEVTCRAA